MVYDVDGKVLNKKTSEGVELCAVNIQQRSFSIKVSEGAYCTVVLVCNAE